MTKNTSGWGYNGVRRETDAQWIARKGHLNAWVPDLDDNAPAVMSSKSQSDDPERNLLLAVIQVALEDVLCIGERWKQPCIHCDPYQMNKKALALTKRRTHQECAGTWLESQQAKDICDALGLEISYLKREIAKRGQRG